MITCIDMKVKNYHILDQSTKRCTLLIPDSLLHLFLRLKKVHKGTKPFLKAVIAKYRNSQNRFYFRKDIGVTIAYQSEGLCLHREDFRPLEKDWLELKLMASSANMSVCAFFVFLLTLELAGGFEEGEVPPSKPAILLLQSLTTDQNSKFSRILHLRI